MVRREVERARAQVHYAEAALHRCESQVYVDRDGHAHYSDCSQYRRALQQAQQLLARAEQSLAVAKRWQSNVNQAVQQYRVHSTRMQQITTIHIRNPQVSWDKRACRALVQVDAEGLDPEMVGNQIAEELLEVVSAIVVTQIENLHVDVLDVAPSQN